MSVSNEKRQSLRARCITGWATRSLSHKGFPCTVSQRQCGGWRGATGLAVSGDVSPLGEGSDPFSEHQASGGPRGSDWESPRFPSRHDRLLVCHEQVPAPLSHSYEWGPRQPHPYWARRFSWALNGVRELPSAVQLLEALPRSPRVSCSQTSLCPFAPGYTEPGVVTASSKLPLCSPSRWPRHPTVA